MTPEILRANELYHDQEAEGYDESQPYIQNAFAQRMFVDDISAIVKTLSGAPGPLSVLDCGAGAGNPTLRFLRHGCR